MAKTGRPKEHDAGREKVRRLLERYRGQWVPLNTILRLGVAQYNARILELRRDGLRIENRCEWINGKKCTWFALDPARTAFRSSARAKQQEPSE